MNIEQLQTYTKDFPAIPISINFEMNNFDPIAVTQRFDQPDKPCFLLTGKPKKTEDGYSFIGLNPTMTLAYRNGRLTTTDDRGNVSHETTDLKPVLERILADNKMPKLPNTPPFSGGLVGYFSYDYARYATTANLPTVDDPMQLNDVDLLLIDQVIAYNHTTKLVTLTQVIPSDQLNEKYDSVVADLNKLKDEITQVTDQQPLPLFTMTPFKLQFSLDEFTEKVAEAKQHIVDGDIFQVQISNPQHAKMTGSLFAATPTLFKESPSPYQFYFRHNDFETIGASPETMITKRDQTLFTYPLAGTRRRGKNKAEDDAFAEELQHNPKELSEHNMLIDLGRNDLGSISKFGSVHVTAYRNLLKFSNVMHMGSVVESTVDKGVSSIDIINSLLPAGTLSGAPKISAMQIIGELENNKHGLYGGCLGYLGFDGDLDMCIGIRLAYRKGADLVVRSAAGIVADSIPKHEYQEFNNKARAIVTALQETAEKGGVADALSY
ncbi:aminodeoxychorismate synthase component 1 [Lentilactobacillus sunkii]|jgi:anthranilate synthase component 1|uniref:Anthranilate synthase component 1 n=1 Tax=Lentilactobacillus sunkii TaxID=481719 RepID=A0A1E7XI51_9LACO|nr:chorismate-binding protein [Lentilactobacillus sunkii]OFA12796.1 aminodeoxychorismate synthase component 1 [Lentilactobacillus sunkii]